MTTAPKSRKNRVDDRNPFDTPAKRRAMPVSKQPRRVLRIRKGHILEHRRNHGDGTWQSKLATGKKYVRIWLGASDEFTSADDVKTLSFEQAIQRAKDLAGKQAVEQAEQTGTTAPWTVADALGAYEADLTSRGQRAFNATYPRHHLTKALLGKYVMLLEAEELSAIACGPRPRPPRTAKCVSWLMPRSIAS